MVPPLSPLAPELPLLELEWDAFERFCCDLVHRLPGVEQSHRHGVQGDTQGGIDIAAKTIDGQRWAYQCKCVRQFGPADLRKAIAAVSHNADRYVLLLASRATASLRSELEQHPKWELWDADDISRRVRQLSPGAARNVVEAHFGAGWRSAFLGQGGLDQFVTATAFFSPFMDRCGLFHHSWTAVGREDVIQQLVTFSRTPVSRIALLQGRGGIGKSKVLHAFAQAVEEPEVHLRFLVPGVPLARESFDQLDPVPCVIVVDDAHGRDDLSILLAAARRRDPPTKLLLALRPHALDRILGEAARAGFDQHEIVVLDELRELNQVDSERLAREALGPEYAHLTDVLAAKGWDSPLVTVLGGRLVATAQLHPGLLSQHSGFRRAVMDAFSDALNGTLGGSAAPPLYQELLRLASAVGPFRFDLQAFRDAACGFVGVDQPALLEAIGEMEDAGVLLRRGNTLCVTPDLLSEHVLEQACITKDGTSTGYADLVYSAFKGVALSALLQNLAGLDWLRHQADTSAVRQPVLRSVWSEVEREFRGASAARQAEVIGQMGVAAFYQPQAAMRLARIAMRRIEAESKADVERCRVVAEGLPAFLEKIAWNAEYTAECCDLLWKLGRDDAREPWRDYTHAISILQELASYRTYKNLDVQVAVVTAAERWLEDTDAHDHLHSPVDVLNQVFAKTAISPQQPGGEWQPFPVAPAPTAALRERAISVVGRLLAGADVRGVLRGVRSLVLVLQEPLPIWGMELPDGFAAMWGREHRCALALLADLCTRSTHPRVLLACLGVLGRHARYAGGGRSAEEARELSDSIKRDFDLRLSEALGRVTVPEVYRVEPWITRFAHLAEQEQHEAGRGDTAAELLAAYPDAAEAAARIAAEIHSLESLGYVVLCASLAEHLAELDPDYTAVLCERVVAGPPSPLRQHLAAFLYRVRKYRPERYLGIASHILHDANAEDMRTLAETLWDPFDEQSTGENDELLARALAHVDEAVRWSALPTLHLLARRNPERALELAASMEVGRSARVADRFAELFSGVWGIEPDALPARAWEVLLPKLIPAESLSFWVLRLLRAASFHAPRALARMLMSRVRRSATETASYEPLPPMMTARALEGFLSCSEHDLVLRSIRDAALTLPLGSMTALAYVYALVSVGYDDVGKRVLGEWVDSGSEQKFTGACVLLGLIAPDFVVQSPDFIENLLRKADVLSEAVLLNTCALLRERADWAAIVPELGDSILPSIVEVRERASAIAMQPNRFSVFREFYRAIADSADSWINDAHARTKESAL